MGGPSTRATFWSQYLDTSVHYDMVTESAGDFHFIFRSTNTREFKTRLRTGVPIIDTLDQIDGPLKFKGHRLVGMAQGILDRHAQR